MHTISWLENLKERDHAEELGVDGRVILEWIFWEQGRKWWNGCIWLRIGGEVLRIRTWTFGFHKRRGNVLNSPVTTGFSRKTLLHGVSESVTIHTHWDLVCKCSSYP